MTAIQSAQQVEAELRGMLAASKPGQAPKAVALADDYIRDFAKIGSLLTDKTTCVNHLARLNSSLLMMAERRNLRKQGRFGRKNKLVKESFNYQAVDGRVVSGAVRKHGNILRDFLDTWETVNNFNRGTHEDGGLPNRTALLTGFLPADVFRRYLLKHGFHWNDIGVAENHGEFTHRLHWYIICSELMGNPNWLQHEPIDLFKKCATAETVNSDAASNKSIWDRLFDHIGETSTDGPAAGTAIVFRRAEVLHSFLRTDASKKRSDLWVLAQVIDSGAARVRLINTLGGEGGNSRIDLDLRARQTALDGELLKLGMEGIHAKVVWQRLQEGGDNALLNEFLA